MLKSWDIVHLARYQFLENQIRVRCTRKESTDKFYKIESPKFYKIRRNLERKQKKIRN